MIEDQPGYLWAEHGLLAKRVPNTQSVRVPFLARWPGHLPKGVEDAGLVANVDIAPTTWGPRG